MELIFEYRFKAKSWSHAALLLNVAEPSELKVVGWIDDSGVEHQGEPPTEVVQSAKAAAASA